MGTTHFSGPVVAMGVPLPIVGGIPSLGDYRIVDASPSDELRQYDKLYTTIQAAVDAANAGDTILIAPGSYDEALTVSESNIVLYGCGNLGAVSVVPSATNATAIKVQGTATRTSDVTFVNVGAESNGTGIGFHVLGNTRRIRAYGCKFEGGTDALKLESDATGSVGDCSFDHVEVCWATNGLHFTASGGGDPVTQTMLRDCFFHNIVTDVVKTSVSHSADIWLINPVMANNEDGTQPTQFLDIDEASTTGFITGGRYSTTLYSTAKFAIAAGVITVDWKTEQEMESTDGGTAGRPDA